MYVSLTSAQDGQGEVTSVETTASLEVGSPGLSPDLFAKSLKKEKKQFIPRTTREGKSIDES